MTAILAQRRVESLESRAPTPTSSRAQNSGDRYDGRRCGLVAVARVVGTDVAPGSAPR